MTPDARERLQKRFKELQLAGKAIPMLGDISNKVADYSAWGAWFTSTLNLIRLAFGEASPHFRNLDRYSSSSFVHQHELDGARGVFNAALEDFEGGYFVSLAATISGEVLGDFVLLAKEALSQGHTDVAGVLASAALEDALKRLASQHGLPVADRSMQDVIGALKAQGLVGGAQKTLLDGMPKIRDHAMHANWDKLDGPAVNGVIGFVEQFLLTHFG